jgi:hypothetical protein
MRRLGDGSGGGQTTPAAGPAAPETQHSLSMITAVVAFYWVISLSLVFLNKYIFRCVRPSVRARAPLGPGPAC